MPEALLDGAGDLVFSLDNIWISKLDGCKLKKVLIPATFAGQIIPHGISRNIKHILRITCMSTGAACITTHMVISQLTEPVRMHLEEMDMQIWRHLTVKRRQKPYMIPS
jgi:hypothetical protein